MTADPFAPLIQTLDPDRHVLIAGPTASGKSALALAIAQAQGGTIVNADALQVWSCWRILTARPPVADEMAARHVLYGHIPPGQSYSVGDWLRQVQALSGRLIIAGGTGLYLSALTQGLADIPATPAPIRALSDARLAKGDLAGLIGELDPATRAKTDLNNPVRVQRAWEVLTSTGRGLAAWQADTPPPLVAPETAACLVLTSDRDWLADRIARRFDLMIRQGALDEVRAILPDWSPQAQWARAIGAAELVAHLHGQMPLDEARERAIIATRQYAKSQRIWFRNRMKNWQQIRMDQPIV